MAAGAFVGGVAAIPAHAASYDIVSGFSSSNPRSVWSYSYAWTDVLGLCLDTQCYLYYSSAVRRGPTRTRK